MIDNTCGKLNIALKSFHYEVGYHNLDPSTGIIIVDKSTGEAKSFRLYGGLYTFEQISRFFIESVPGITIRLNLSGLVEFNVPQSVSHMNLESTLTRFIGITQRGKNRVIGKFVGDIPVKQIVHKWLYIYLDQLSTTSNIVDGAPSTLLAIVPASATRGIINITPSNPTFKKLAAGHIHQLNLRVLDENDTVVLNHGNPMTAIL